VNDDVNIVVVDDNEIDLMIGKRLISRVNSNIKVKTFSSICEVISWVNSEEEYFKKNKVVFFIDIYMPHGNGFKLSEDIFNTISNEKDKNAIFYLLSATIDDVDLRKVKKSDLIKGFIGKPLTVEIINQVISDLPDCQSPL
jgi:response regulator RpfG family c-di-GMP phosphodiesterase